MKYNSKGSNMHHSRARKVSSSETLASIFDYNAQRANTNHAQIEFLKENLRRCISEDLSPRQAEIILMRYYHGQTMRSIGAALGINASTVCRTLHRAEKRMKKLLKYSTMKFVLPEE